MRTKRYIDVMTANRLKKAKFKPLTGDLKAKATQLFWNLWNQFGLTPKKVDRIVKNGGEKERPSIQDYAWTPAASHVFYNHPRHKAFVAQVQAMRGMTWGMFKLNFEPCDYDPVQDINGIFAALKERTRRCELNYIRGVRSTSATAPRGADNHAKGTLRRDRDQPARNTSIRAGKKDSQKRVSHARTAGRTGSRTAGCCAACGCCGKEPKV